MKVEFDVFFLSKYIYICYNHFRNRYAIIATLYVTKAFLLLYLKGITDPNTPKTRPIHDCESELHIKKNKQLLINS